MHDITCPHCHTAFKIDESGYADIARQVRDRDFARYTVEQADDYRKRSMTAHASGPQQ